MNKAAGKIRGALQVGVVSALLAAAGAAPAVQGLWVGSATLNAVSTVNHGEPDLSFDLAVQGLTREHVLLSRGADGWEYARVAADPTWLTGTDAATAVGPAPLGSGVTGVATEVPTADGAVYLRRSFLLSEDPAGYHRLRLRLWRNDGVVVYLNGSEVARNNLTATGQVVPPDAFALSEVGDQLYLEFPLPTGGLLPGTNWVAAQLHRSAASDADWFFDLELAATLETTRSETLVAENAAGWEYSDADPPPADWPTGSGWPTAVAPIGYGNDGEQTTLDYGADPKPAVTYFRRSFDAGSHAFTHLRFLLRRDDGAAVYLNGSEVFRTNLPQGPLGQETAPLRALGPSEEGRYMVQELDLREWQGEPVQGPTTVAAAVYQHPSELAATGGTTAPVRTPAELSLRLLVHVDAGGETRLLKHVVELYDADAGELVLVSDDALLATYRGATLRDGQWVGRRVSAVGFDWDGAALACGTGFAATGTVTCPQFVLAPEHPTNPFLHRYHPDHDNWDARYETPTAEAYTVRRQVTLELSARYPADPDLPERRPPPGWGHTTVGGVYREIVHGLHRNPITALGWFQLERVTATARLEP